MRYPSFLAKLDSKKQYSLDLAHESYKSTYANTVKVIELARGAPGLRLLWVMKTDKDKKWVHPCGLMIVTLQQILLGALKEHPFE